ncbi:MAG: hypothetical protein HKP61_17810 [Dactylosporangium sp.]|nr:hypothetical protein [Dactylosporangium sp.]NNJ62754.1 hypothetical protein [Dactylosporangium sp.]
MIWAGGKAMGSLDEARAAAATFRQQLEQNITQLQSAGQGVISSQQGLRGRIGSTNQPKMLEAEARCQDARQKIAEAIQSVTAAREAAGHFSAALR